MEETTIIGTVCFIQHVDSGAVLLLERSRDPMKGLWTGVGGKTQLHEDVHASCLREIQEETGLSVDALQLHGVVRTIHDTAHSSWLLFVYTANAMTAQIIDCPEGKLRWVDMCDLGSYTLIPFIRRLVPMVFSPEGFFEGTLRHDAHGNIVEEQLRLTLSDKALRRSESPPKEGELLSPIC